ncbi:hypothetical protein D3C83_158920 [compost metagenome]
MPRNETYLPSSDNSNAVTVMLVSRVRRVAFFPSTSNAHRLEIGDSGFRMLTVNRFSRRSFSSRSIVSAVMK